MAAMMAQWMCGWLPWRVVVTEAEGFLCFLSSPEFPSHLGNLWWCAPCFLHERNNTTSAILILGFCSSSSFDCISCLRTASVVLCLGLPPASATVAGCSLAALYWKLVDLMLAEAATGLGFCCSSEHSCYFLGTACFDFAPLAFYEGRYLTCSTSQTHCIVLLWGLASLELGELRRLRCRGLWLRLRLQHLLGCLVPSLWATWIFENIPLGPHLDFACTGRARDF